MLQTYFAPHRMGLCSILPDESLVRRRWRFGYWRRPRCRWEWRRSAFFDITHSVSPGSVIPHRCSIFFNVVLFRPGIGAPYSANTGEGNETLNSVSEDDIIPVSRKAPDSHDGLAPGKFLSLSSRIDACRREVSVVFSRSSGVR